MHISSYIRNEYTNWKLPMKEMNQKMLVLRSLCLFLLVLMVNSTPPEETVKCSSKNTNCTITNYLGEFPDSSTCKAANVVFPKTEQELLSIVGNASRNNRKVRVITRFSHSIPKLVCTDGEDGLLIGTKNLNRTLAIDKTKMTITVECGVSLRELIKKAAEAGLVLPYTPYWSGLTIGGILSTGAHGSSLWGVGSSIHDYVEEMRIVHPVGPTEGYAKITTVDTSHPHLNAVKVSLGVLGVISQVTLRLQPMFKRSVTILEKNDSNFAVMATTWGNQHEFGDMAWFPNQRKVLYRVDDRVPSNTSGNGLNDFTGFRSTSSIAIALIRSIEETKEATNSADGKCVVAKLTSSILKNGGFGYTNDGSSFKGYPIIGFQNRLQASSSCLDSPQDHGLSGCAWDPEITGHQFYHQTTFSIGLSKVQNFIEDMQKLRDLKPEAFCGTELSAGILLRYVKRSDAYLGKEEDGIDFDITYYRSHDPLAPRLYEDILEEVEQIGLFKYGALPHWGKNRNIAFEGVIKKYEKASEFLKVKAIYDPLGIFSSKWTDQMLGLQGGVTIIKNGCALEGLCICSQDIHCAPDKGYFCRPGRIYKDARVCSRRKIAAS